MNCKKFGVLAALVFIFLTSTTFALKLGQQSVVRSDFSDSSITKAEIYAAEASLPDPGILPDSPLYGLKRLAEDIALTLTFNELEQTKLRLKLSELRLSETMRMIKENKIEAAKRAGEDLAAEMNKIEITVSKLGRGSSKETGEILGRNAIAIAIALEKAPDELKRPIERAFNYSLKLKSRETKYEIEADEIKEKIKKIDADRSVKEDNPGSSGSSGRGSSGSGSSGSDSSGSGSDSGTDNSSVSSMDDSSGSGSISSGSGDSSKSNSSGLSGTGTGSSGSKSADDSSGSSSGSLGSSSSSSGSSGSDNSSGSSSSSNSGNDSPESSGSGSSGSSESSGSNSGSSSHGGSGSVY